jgi:hypothetical protein
MYTRNIWITHCHHYVLHLPEAESNANQKLCIWQYSPKGQQCFLLIWTSSRHQLSNGSDRVKSEGVPDLQQSEKLASRLHGIWKIFQAVDREEKTVIMYANTTIKASRGGDKEVSSYLSCLTQWEMKLLIKLERTKTRHVNINIVRACAHLGKRWKRT